MRRRSRLLPALLLTAALLLVGGSAAHAQTPSPSPVPTPTPTPSPVPPPPFAACGVTYDATPWGGSTAGFTANVTVTNTGTVPVTWQVAIVLETGTFNQGWSAAYTDVGTVILAEPLAWNREIAPSSSVTFGFNGFLAADLHSISATCPEV